MFIWEEISSQHRRDFKAVYNAKEIKQLTGKILILMGDAMQIAPVVLHGSRDQVVQSSIYTWPDLADFFERDFFTHNLRSLR